MHSSTIIVPTLAEARAFVGAGPVMFSSAALQAEASAALVAEISNPDSDIDDRFNAALALRGRDLKQDGDGGQKLIAELLRLVSITVAAPTDDGRESFTVAEKRTGILAAIALQRTVLHSAEMVVGLQRQIEAGIASMKALAVDYLARTVGPILFGEPSRSSAKDGDERVGMEVGERREHLSNVHWAYRAVVMLSGDSESPERVSFTPIVDTLCKVLVDRQVDDSLKIFVVNALSGRDELTIGLCFLAVVSDPKTSPTLRAHILKVMAIYRPQATEIEESIRNIIQESHTLELLQQLNLEGVGEQLTHAIRVALERTLKPKFSAGEGDQARKEIATESWRVLLHLKSLESRLLRGAGGDFLEMAPAGTRGDLETFELIRSER